MQISLKAMRVNANLTQGDVAKALGVTIRTIKNWECGDVSPNLEMFDLMCKLYGCGRDDIFVPKKLTISEPSESETAVCEVAQ